MLVARRDDFDMAMSSTFHARDKAAFRVFFGSRRHGGLYRYSASASDYDFDGRVALLPVATQSILRQSYASHAHSFQPH